MLKDTKKTESIQWEPPVPLTDRKTLEKFDGAVSKAGMLYATVTKSKEYQFALLEDNGKFSVMYTSKKDGTVVVRELDYDNVEFDESKYGYKNGYAPGFMKVSRPIFVNKSLRMRLPLYGIIAHNGFIIADTKYSSTINVGNSFIIGYTPMNKNGDNHVDILDYKGNIRLQIFGKMDVSLNEVEHENEIIYIIAAKNFDLSKYKEAYINVFIAYKDKLFKSSDLSQRDYSGVEVIRNELCYLRWEGLADKTPADKVLDLAFREITFETITA